MSPRLEKGIGEGFVFAPFSNPSKGIFTIPDDECPADFQYLPADSTIPAATPREDYINEVETIIDALSGIDGKVVASRVIRIDKTIDLRATFDALDKAFPMLSYSCFRPPAMAHGSERRPNCFFNAPATRFKQWHSPEHVLQVRMVHGTKRTYVSSSLSLNL